MKLCQIKTVLICGSGLFFVSCGGPDSSQGSGAPKQERLVKAESQKKAETERKVNNKPQSPVSPKPQVSPSPSPSASASEVLVLRERTPRDLTRSADYILDVQSGGYTGIGFRIKYTLGEHKGTVGEASGEVSLTSEGPLKLKSAKFSVPISSIRTGDETRDCHLVEALGLNYEKSFYPERHVCDRQNVLPTSGENSVAFKNITLEISGIRIAEGENDKLVAGKDVQVQATGLWTVHGVTKEVTFPLVLRANEERTHVQVKGSLQLSLKDFGVKIIPFLLITVDDAAIVELDMRFSRKSI
jgi:polyisoprenoid-binding protein YceI